MAIKRNHKLHVLAQVLSVTASIVTGNKVQSVSFNTTDETTFLLHIEKQTGEDAILSIVFRDQDPDYIVGALSSHILTDNFIHRVLLISADLLITDMQICI